MAELRIQFLAFEGCPLAGAARNALDEAMTALELRAYEIVDLLDPETPRELRNWGSPTILVNGRDVTGGRQGNNVGCRVYSGPSKVPAAQTIIDYVRREMAS